jgi:dTDP-4-amino-4,6-dideoxygalactose transaminase
VRVWAILLNALQTSKRIKHFPIDTPQRRNGWYVLAFSLDVENMKCDIQQFVAAAAAEGAPVWKVFWPQCHTERAFQEHNAFGRTGFPFKSKEYVDSASANYEHVNVPNARGHETRTFTCFAFRVYTESDMEQIANAILKVIKVYEKTRGE